MARAADVVELHLDIRVIYRPLENLAIRLEDGRPGGFGLPYNVADGLLKQTTPYRAVESHQHAQLPLRAGVTRFLRKPNVKLSPRQRKCPAIKFHSVCLSKPRFRCLLIRTPVP